MGDGANNPSAWEANDRIRRDGSHNLVDAAIAAGASRYLQESIVFVYADGGEQYLAEYVDALADALGVPSPAERSLTLELPAPFSVRLRSLRVSNQRFKETTGWQLRFPSAWEGWNSVISDWRTHRARAGLS